MPKISRDVGPTFAGVTSAPTVEQVAAAEDRQGTDEFGPADARVLQLQGQAETEQAAKDEDKAGRREQRRDADPETRTAGRRTRGANSTQVEDGEQASGGDAEEVGGSSPGGSTSTSSGKPRPTPSVSGTGDQSPAPSTASPSKKGRAGSSTAGTTDGSGPATPSSASSKAGR